MRYCSAVLALALALGTSSASAQEWSAQQAEVWSAAAKLTAHFYAGELDAAYEMVHRDFVFWNSHNSVPGTRETARQLDQTWSEVGGRWIDMETTPLSIQVFEDFAVVNFYARGYQEATRDGDPQWVTARILMVMKQEDGRWLQVANFIHNERE